METAKGIFRGETCYFDYQPILECFGKILLQVDSNFYTGDSALLYQSFSGDKYGYLVFGWGSCSGCDALQGCDNIDEVQELMDSLMNSIKWFESLEELQTYFNEKDWELEWFYSSDITKEFITKVIQYDE